MNKLITTCAVLALSACFSGPMFAQATSAPASQDQSMPSSQTPSSNQPSTGMQSDQPSSTMGTQSQTQSASPSQAAASDLTGQTIYTAKGKKIGTVSAMSTDAHGQQAAAVNIEQYLGMGGQTVLIPVSSLQARSNGGYSTSLSSTEIKSLAKSGGSSMSSPQH